MTLDDRPTHPADHAYVLKFRLDSAPDQDVWTGRIEHLDSGRRCDFRSRDELLAWLAADHGGAHRARPSTAAFGTSPITSAVSRPHPDRSQTER